jgi:serine/threonine protein kinase
MNTAPERIGPYQVLSVMGHGGSGIVAKCRHERTDGLAAVKFARDPGGLHRDFLRKEVAMLSRLGREGNDRVVRVIESGLDGGILWYAMEFIDGPDLAGVAQSLWTGSSGGAFSLTVTDVADIASAETAASQPAISISRLFAVAPPAESGTRAEVANGHLREVLDLMLPVAEVVAFVHGAGIVHGDLKPRNVLFRANGGTVLVDFGAAIYAFAGATTREIAQRERLRHGTRGYMAPEQIRGEPLDGRSDLYALGCILFELLVGRRPFVADDAVALQNQHLHVTPPRPSSLVDRIPPALDDLVLRLLAKDPRERIGYAEDVVETLASLLAPAGAPAKAAPSSPRHVYRPRMVGRDAELQRALVPLRSARDGRGGLLFVAGESGVGKTRFVNELGGRAVGMDMEVVIGQSSQIAQSSSGAVALRGAAFQPFVSLLHRVVDRCSAPDGHELEAELQASLAVLAPYEPSLAGLPAVARQVPSELPHALARARVFRSMAQVIVRFAQERPLLLVLDDLHWADDLTLAFLQWRNLSAIEEAPVLIVGTYRPEQVDPELHAAAQACSGGMISLERLTLDCIRSMVKDMLASPMAPEGLVGFLHRHSEGNPFFAAEYLHTIIRRGLLFRDAERLWQGPELATPEPGDVDLPVPASLQGLLEARMEGLSPAAAGVLELASVLGRDFELDLLAAFKEAPTAGDALAVEELVARQIIEESGHRRYRFVHDKIRETREQAIPAERRRALHAIAAGRLVEIDGGSGEHLRDAAVGIHWAGAGMPERAFAFLETGARAAEAVFANAQAVQLYQIALGQAQAAGLRDHDEGRATLRRISEALADLLVRNAQHAEGRGYLDWALNLTGGQPGLSSARLLRKKAQSFWTVHQYEQASAALAAADAELGTMTSCNGADQHREWIEIQQGLFWRYYFGRQTGPATERIIAGMAKVIEQHGTVLQRATYYVCAALDILGRHRYRYSDEAVAFTRKALEAASGNPRCTAEVSLARFNLGFALLLGQSSCCAEAAQHLREAVAESERIGDATLLARSLTYLAVAHRRLDHVEDAATVADRAMAAAEDAQLAPYVGAAAACRAWVHWKRREPDRTRASAVEAQRWWRKGAHAFPFRWLLNFPLLDLELRDDAIEAGRDLIGDLLDEQQQVFPPVLDAALKEASSTPPDSYRSFSEATRAVLEIARELKYL